MLCIEFRMRKRSCTNFSKVSRNGDPMGKPKHFPNCGNEISVKLLFKWFPRYCQYGTVKDTCY